MAFQPLAVDGSIRVQHTQIAFVSGVEQHNSISLPIFAQTRFGLGGNSPQQSERKH
jgi:hypothetical protein